MGLDGQVYLSVLPACRQEDTSSQARWKEDLMGTTRVVSLQPSAELAIDVSIPSGR